uniref:Peptidase C1A papain C-terminal domain-containing protein n=1 Tax=Panagrolaimus sp. ES5 TaxID=591445 RepID=A0AC34FA21_9BILA
MDQETIIGILVDVSGSMQESLKINVGYGDNDISRIQTVIKTILDIFKREAELHIAKKVFSLAFGIYGDEEKGETVVCDLLALVRLSVNLKTQMDIPNRKTNLDRFLKSREVMDAKEYINKHLTSEECAFIYALSQREGNESKINEIIESLPFVCTHGWLIQDVNNEIDGFFIMLSNIGLSFAKKAKHEMSATKTKKAANNAKRDFMLNEFKKIEHPNVVNITEAIDILESAQDEETINGKLDKEKLDKILEHIEPYIYGCTPMCKALELAKPLFSAHYRNKILFLITDGGATDGDPTKFVQDFKDNNITVIVCLLTATHIKNPRQLHYKIENRWPKWERNMLKLATAIDNVHPLMSILLERGWKLAPEGRSRLFFQANHPDIVSEIGDIISADNNDLVLNVITRAYLDEYINPDKLIEKKEIQPPHQKGGTCYANSAAYVIYLSLKRIYKREGQEVTFDDLRKDMINKYKDKGAVTKKVLDEYCSKYNLKCAEVNETEAKIAVSKRRAVATIFALEDDQWNDFENFYASNKKGILRKCHLRHTKSNKKSGHAVILVKVTPEYLLLMNSWGSAFADDGFFRVENAAVLNMQFFDVFWTVNDLKKEEKAAYYEMKKSGAMFIDKIPASIKSLPYTCPKCTRTSPANTFAGHFQEAICPKCEQRFIPLLLYFAMF